MQDTWEYSNWLYYANYSSLYILNIQKKFVRKNCVAEKKDWGDRDDVNHLKKKKKSLNYLFSMLMMDIGRQ